jgi:hypothetical protein
MKRRVYRAPAVVEDSGMDVWSDVKTSSYK